MMKLKSTIVGLVVRHWILTDPTLKALGLRARRRWKPNQRVIIDASSGVRSVRLARGGFIEASPVSRHSLELEIDTVGAHPYEHTDAMTFRSKWIARRAAATEISSELVSYILRSLEVAAEDQAHTDSPRAPRAGVMALQYAPKATFILLGRVQSKEMVDDNFYWHGIYRIDYAGVVLYGEPGKVRQVG